MSADRFALEQADRLSRWGRHLEAAPLYRQAMAGLDDPSGVQRARLGLAQALGRIGALAEAVAVARQAVALDGSANALLAMLLVDAGALDEAAAAAVAALACTPGSAAMLNLSGSVALRRGRAAEAAAFARSALAYEPEDQRALSILALGDAAAGEHLLDFDRVVRLGPAASPDGFASLPTFIDALAHAVLASADLGATSPDAPLVGGRRLADAFQIPPALSRGLAQLFRDAAAGYAADSGVEAPPRLTVRAWANVMSQGAGEAAHIHEGGWLSGVLYLALPDGGGEIVLGGHDFGAGVPRGPNLTLRPGVGDLLLFPSYLYHSVPTVTAPGQRISIAFDACRA